MASLSAHISVYPYAILHFIVSDFFLLFFSLSTRCVCCRFGLFTFIRVGIFFFVYMPHLFLFCYCVWFVCTNLTTTIQKEAKKITEKKPMGAWFHQMRAF